MYWCLLGCYTSTDSATLLQTMPQPYHTHIQLSINQSISQSINQSLFQAEAHRTNNKENANTGNRTEQTQKNTSKKTTTKKHHSLQNTQRESLQPNYEHAKSLTKRTSLVENTLKRCKNLQLALCNTVLILGTPSCNNISVTLQYFGYLLIYCTILSSPCPVSYITWVLAGFRTILATFSAHAQKRR